MAASNLQDVFRVPGTLVLAPASVTSPYGGTPLGRVRKVELEWGLSYDDVEDESNRQVTESGVDAYQPVLHFALEQWDDDVVKRAFPGVTQSGPSGRARVDGGSVPGPVLAIDPVLFLPNDPLHRAFYMRRPLLYVAQSAQTSLALKDLALLALLMKPTLDTNYATIPPWQWRLLGDITL